MKNRDILKIWDCLSIVGEHNNTMFNYVLLRNKRKMKDTVDVLKELQFHTKIDGHSEFEKDRLVLCVEHSHKNENGDPKMVAVPNTNIKTYDIADHEKFDEGVQKLLDSPKHDTYNKHVHKRHSEFEELLDKDAGEIDFIKISLVDLPSDLSTVELQAIELFVNE